MKDPIEQQNINDTDVVKMAEEYIRKNNTLSNGEMNANKTRFFALRDVLADFAEFYHREKMNELWHNTEVRQKIFNYFANEHNVLLISSDFRELELLLSDLTKNDEG